jgi:hypothetical protein
MDFVTGLPKSTDKEYDTIWVVVDRLTKTRHLVPCHSTVDAQGLADLFLQHVFRLHGLPRTKNHSSLLTSGDSFAATLESIDDFPRPSTPRLTVRRRESTR